VIRRAKRLPRWQRKIIAAGLAVVYLGFAWLALNWLGQKAGRDLAESIRQQAASSPKAKTN